MPNERPLRRLAFRFAMCAGLAGGCDAAESFDSQFDTGIAQAPDAAASDAGAAATDVGANQGQPRVEVVDRDQLREDAAEASRAFVSARRATAAWLARADESATGLLTNTRSATTWTPRDAGADLFGFVAMAAHIFGEQAWIEQTDAMLATERRLCPRLASLPDAIDTESGTFVHDDLDVQRVVFDAAEFAKDGLLPMTELLGAGPWRDRLDEIVLDLWHTASVETDAGVLPAANGEVAGDILMISARTWWRTRDERVLDGIERMATYYLLTRPLADRDYVRLQDHGGEIFGGLVEALIVLRAARPETSAVLADALTQLLDEISEYGRNDDGFWYQVLDLSGETVLDDDLSDTWGYLYAAAIAWDDEIGRRRFRTDVQRLLLGIDQYRDHRWEGGGWMDGYADAIESALLMFAATGMADGGGWLEHNLSTMIRFQDGSGFVDATYRDGNFVRTGLMHALRLTRGVTLVPWDESVRLAAREVDETLWVYVAAESDFSGTIRFDSGRHGREMSLPRDYPRLNSWPEYWVAETERTYEIVAGDRVWVVDGSSLIDGVWIEIAAGEAVFGVRRQAM